MTFSRPSRRDSSEREMCPSCEVESRFIDMARCLSNKDSLRWSASRKYWFGFAIVSYLLSASIAEIEDCISEYSNLFPFKRKRLSCGVQRLTLSFRVIAGTC